MSQGDTCKDSIRNFSGTLFEFNNRTNSFIRKLDFLNPETAASPIGFLLKANAVNASYQWLDCNRNYAKIVNETNRLFIPSDTGDFAVEITQNGCVDTSACFPFVITSIQERSIFRNVVIFPNPSKGDLTLRLEGLSQVVIRVYSLEGKLVQEEQGVNSDLHRLKLNVLSGIYILELRSKGEKSHYKIMKR
ncbi:MAG: T9SS type A sorting domain-containing protein [Flavobacteriales bacterium]|nr:T9SS type A sorting domain-containing protein [Flavobacteriales bacterium]